MTSNALSDEMQRLENVFCVVNGRARMAIIPSFAHIVAALSSRQTVQVRIAQSKHFHRFSLVERLARVTVNATSHMQGKTHKK